MRFELDHPTLRLGLVRARGVTCAPSDADLLWDLDALETRLRADASLFDESVKAKLRDVLRKGGYKPTGRGKPASEFLLGAALDKGLLRINNLVDVNNLVSLTHAHPISIFDAARLGAELRIRFGRAGESYVFNASGQSMDIAGLPVVCNAADEPIGNAVKDSMRGKVHEGTRDVLAVVYGTSELPAARLEAVCDELAARLSKHAGAAEVTRTIAPITGP